MESTFNMPLWVSIPFLIMLLAIAVGPVILGKWWDKNKNKLLVSIILSIPVVIYMLENGLSTNLINTLKESLQTL